MYKNKQIRKCQKLLYESSISILKNKNIKIHFSSGNLYCELVNTQFHE